MWFIIVCLVIWLIITHIRLNQVYHRISSDSNAYWAQRLEDMKMYDRRYYIKPPTNPLIGSGADIYEEDDNEDGVQQQEFIFPQPIVDKP